MKKIAILAIMLIFIAGCIQPVQEEDKERKGTGQTGLGMIYTKLLLQCLEFLLRDGID